MTPAIRSCRCAAIILGLLLSIPVVAQPIPARAPGDNLEKGLQGQVLPDELEPRILPKPFSRNVRLVGHTDLGGRGGNMLVSSIDDCAYVSSTKGLSALGLGPATDPTRAGVAVVDVRNPRVPRQIGLMRDKGSLDAVETMHAVVAPGRKVLVAGAYGGGQPGAKPNDAAWLSIYDATDCARPKLMVDYRWPENAHMVTISPNGKRVYGTSINPFTGAGGIQVLDISDMARPKFLGKFEATRPDGTSYAFATHQVRFSPDERRLYAGVTSSKGGDLNRGVPPGPLRPELVGQDAGGLYIFDNSDIVEGRTSPKLRLIGTAHHAGWHSPAPAEIGGVPYIVNSGELGPCPGAWPRITNIANEGNPRVVGEFRLSMNYLENCPPRTNAEKASGGIIGAPGTAASHFNDVDAASDTRLGLFPFIRAGLRIADLRNPANPVEVAYFRPGDECMSHVRYQRRTGHIWFACMASGFYVIELTPELRKALAMPKPSRDRRRIAY